MKHFAQKIIMSILLLAFTVGCTVAVPNVTSLLSSLNSFKLNSTDLRIEGLSELLTVNINASCDATNQSFEYELPDVAPGVWTAVVQDSVFVSVNDQCSALGLLTMTLDLSATAPFSTMVEGETKRIKFRDVNLLPDLSQTEEFRITYSTFKITDDRFINGQGLNNTKSGTTHTLQGRIINVPQLEPVSSGGTHTLQGKVVFQ